MLGIQNYEPGIGDVMKSSMQAWYDAIDEENTVSEVIDGSFDI
jgi:hypothetical protein